MSASAVQPLPVPQSEYDQENERVARRQIEQNMSEVNDRIHNAVSRYSGQSSLSLRRFQFLLMGAPGG